MQIVIKSIAEKYHMSDADFEWLKSHLNTPLPVMSIYWDRPEHGGGLWHITIYKTDGSDLISIFKEHTGLEYGLLW